MSDFLYRLVDRSQGLPTVAAPMIGALFGPGPDVPRTVDTFVEHGDSERTTNGVADSSVARSNPAFDSPSVADTEASFQIADYPAVPRKTDSSLFDQDPTGDFESPRQKRTNLFSPMGSTAELDQAEDIRIDEDRSTDENETSHLPTPTVPNLLTPMGSRAHLDRGEDIRVDEDRSTDEDETSHLLAPTGERPNHIEAGAVSTVIPIREAKRSRKGLDPNRPSLADQDPTDDFERPRQQGTAPVSPTHSTARHEQSPDLAEDIRIDERSTDGREISRALTPETRRRPVDLDRSSAVSTVSTHDRKRPEQALDSEASLIETEDSTGGFEKPRQKPLPLAPARGGTAQLEKRDQEPVNLQRVAEISLPAMEKTRSAGQPPSVRKGGESALLHSTPTVPLGDEVISADRVATLTAKAQRGSVEWLDSDGPAQRPRESIRPPATSVLSKDGSRAALAETLGAGEAPRPIVVSPRIVSDRPSSERYATGQPSVKPAADPIASRREDGASSTPTIRVTIGRIDVRAVSPPQPPAQETAPAAPRMSLDDYLKSPNGGRR